jgi:RES domain
MTPSPPDPFPGINRIELPNATDLHRIHNINFDCDSFNPCKGRPSRFAPLIRPDKTCIPTAYVASNLECSVHETVFHEIQHDAPRKSIGFHVLENLNYAVLRPRRPLRLASLFEPDLNRWGLTRRQLIDTYATDYLMTARWASAIHDSYSDIDGLVWTSRRCDPERAYVLFGDRMRSSELETRYQSRLALTDHVMLQIRNFAERANILIVF